MEKLTHDGSIFYWFITLMTFICTIFPICLFLYIFHEAFISAITILAFLFHD